MVPNTVGTTMHSVLFTSLVLICLLQPYRSLAQTPPLPAEFEARQISLSYRKQSLSAVVADLSQRIGKSILVDDEPLNSGADIEFKGSLKMALDRIGDAFDYSWRLSKRGSILMNKRFRTNPDELPQMNLPELRQMAADMLLVLGALPYDLSPVPVEDHIARILNSLTPEQGAAIRGGAVFYGKDLSVEQRQVLAQYRCNGTFEPVYSIWSALSNALNDLPHAYLQLREYPTFYRKRDGLPPARAGTPTQLGFFYVYHVRGIEKVQTIWFTTDAAAWRQSLER